MRTLLVLVSVLGLAHGYHIFNNGGCQSGHVRCRDSSKCIQLSWVCDGGSDCGNGEDEEDCATRRVDCAGQNLALCKGRPKPTQQPWEGLYLGPGPRQTVNATELKMFSERVAIKMSRLREGTYLEAERLINSVLYKAQTGSLSPHSVISLATQTAAPLSTHTSPTNNSLNLTEVPNPVEVVDVDNSDMFSTYEE